MSIDQTFTCVGEPATSLVKTLIEDLRMTQNIDHGRTPEENMMVRGRRVAVVVLYATGEVGVTEGWSIQEVPSHNDLLLESPGTAQ